MRNTDYYSPATLDVQRLVDRGPLPTSSDALHEYLRVKTRQSVDRQLATSSDTTVEHVVTYREIMDRCDTVIAQIGDDLGDEDVGTVYDLITTVRVREILGHLSGDDHATCEYYIIPHDDGDGIGTCIRIAFQAAEAAADFRRRADL